MRAWDRKGFLIAESDGLLKQSTAGFFSQATARVHARYGDNYPAPIAILSCLFEGIQVPMDKALRVESRYFAQLLTGSVSRNIIRTTFIRKGLAEKGAHRPSGIPKSEIQRIGVLGAGMMGAGVAYVAARSGLGVVLLDVSVETARAGKSYSEKLLAKQAEKGSTRPDEAGALLDRIHPTQDYAALRDVDLIIEAVYEDVAVKATVTQRAAGAMRPGALFASNTSTLPITGLAQSYAHPANFIGLHFFSPVDRMDLVEVIMGRQTSQVALAKALDFIARIRKTPILVNDSRGFFTSRVFQTFIHEGMHLLNEGVVPALIENVARQAGLPMGPLEVTDEVTLDLPLKIVRESEQADPTYRKPASTVVLETMVDKLNRHGKKGGAGFYEHPVGGKKRLWPGLAHYFPVAPEQPGAEEVRKRLLYVQALDTARCLEEGVLTRAADGDLGGVLGWGFPRWTGGPLSLIEAVGVANFVSDCELMAKHYGERFAPTAQLRTMAATGKGFDSL
jgi:3-hydroxyacyl-CoA dehydrogenase/enoyl-CoA hydratase/3-hydroxybutyryl-CoA epimerase